MSQTKDYDERAATRARARSIASRYIDQRQCFPSQHSKSELHYNREFLHEQKALYMLETCIWNGKISK